MIEAGKKHRADSAGVGYALQRALRITAFIGTLVVTAMVLSGPIEAKSSLSAQAAAEAPPSALPTQQSALPPAAAVEPEDAQVVRATFGGRRPGLMPETARTAYVRAAQAMNDADRTCHVPWQLLAGAGWVESRHGTLNGGDLDVNGVDRPALFGPVITRVDSDEGQLDGTASMDRTVGPLQFSPERWRIAGVDGDGDGSRDAQDIDDAALAYAVLLCSGPDDLRRGNATEAALLRINPEDAYPRQVEAAAAYYRKHPGVRSVDDQPFEVVAVEDAQPASEGLSASPSPTATPTNTRKPSAKPTPKATASASPTAIVTPKATSTLTSTSPTPNPIASTSAPSSTG